MSQPVNPDMLLSIERVLPEELLDRVISFSTRESLRSLCLASKTINRLATPYLYSNIYLKVTDDLAALTHLVLTSPSHATLVKSLIVPHTWASVDSYTQPNKWTWPNLQDPAWQEYLKGKCAEYTPKKRVAVAMYEKIKTGANENAVLAFLLANLPNLRRLNINFGILDEHADFQSVWETIAPSIGTSSGSDVSTAPIDILVMGSDDKYSNNTEHLAMFFYLPNLRTLYGYKHGDNEGDPDPDHPFMKLKPRSCQVEFIELRCAKLHGSYLQHLLRAAIPGKLKTFSYEIGGTWAWCEVEHPVIMTSLQPHHETLETLGLSHEDFYPYEGTDGDGSREKPYMCSFTPFSALKKLKVAPVFIWGHDGITRETQLNNSDTKHMLWKSLPAGLEELWITRAEPQMLREHPTTLRWIPECLIPALDLVVQHKDQAFKNLEHIRIELPLLVWKDEWFDILALFCRSATKDGIRTTVILTDMFDRWGRLTIERPWGWNEDVEWEPCQYSQNRECAKLWIDAANHHDISQLLKDLKARFEEENEKLKKAKDKIGELGGLCRDCQLSPDYRADNQIDDVQLAQWIDERLQTKTGWKGRSGAYPVVT